jgi:hypothetical protein
MSFTWPGGYITTENHPFGWGIWHGLGHQHSRGHGAPSISDGGAAEPGRDRLTPGTAAVAEGVEPESGVVGQAITIRGRNLSGTTAVIFSGTPSTRQSCLTWKSGP